jgi:hypothetical protein
MVGALLIGLKVFGEKIGEEKQLEDREHDNQLDDYQLPQRFAQSHAAKTAEVKTRDAGWVRIFHHNKYVAVLQAKISKVSRLRQYLFTSCKITNRREPVKNDSHSCPDIRRFSPCPLHFNLSFIENVYTNSYLAPLYDNPVSNGVNHIQSGFLNQRELGRSGDFPGEPHNKEQL